MLLHMILVYYILQRSQIFYKVLYRDLLFCAVYGFGFAFLLFLCWTGNLIIQWASENVMIEICHVFNIYYSGVGSSEVVQIQKLVLLSGVYTK